MLLGIKAVCREEERGLHMRSRGVGGIMSEGEGGGWLNNEARWNARESKGL